MLDLIHTSPGRLCDRRPDFMSRRRLLQVGGLSLAGLSLPALLRSDAAAAAGTPGRAAARSCILIFLNGGPSHLDMWDMKPDAPVEVRGEFKAIPTPVDGILMSEHLPRVGALARDFSLVRSLHHRVSNAHAAAVYLALTGDDRGDVNVTADTGSHFPAIGSVAARMLPTRPGMLPYVSLPYRTKEGAGGPPQPGFYGGWMGGRYDPLFVLKDPNAPDFALPELTLPEGFTAGRVAARRNLLRAVNRRLDEASRTGSLRALDAFQQQALDLVTSPETRRAFDIAAETSKTRESYGRNIYGQSVLLARRLVEAGCRVVTMSWAPDANATWDTHGGNFQSLKGTLLPQLDAALASLLADLKGRGLLDDTLVVCMGEFGRTPKVNNAAGRDHWPGCYSALFAGGGVAGGRVVGASDAHGAEPVDTPLTPLDAVATIYRLLGISPETEFPDPLDRPLKILNGHGRLIHELLA